jgi:hypothetical protein
MSLRIIAGLQISVGDSVDRIDCHDDSLLLKGLEFSPSEGPASRTGEGCAFAVEHCRVHPLRSHDRHWML